MQLQIYTNPTWNSEIQFYTSVVQPVCVLCICLQFHKCTFSAKPFEEVNTSFQFEPEPQSTVTMHLVSDEKLSGDLNDSMLLWHLWRLCVVLKMHISLLFMVEHNPPLSVTAHIWGLQTSIDWRGRLLSNVPYCPMVTRELPGTWFLLSGWGIRDFLPAKDNELFIVSYCTVTYVLRVAVANSLVVFPSMAMIYEAFLSTKESLSVPLSRTIKNLKRHLTLLAVHHYHLEEGQGPFYSFPTDDSCIG